MHPTSGRDGKRPPTVSDALVEYLEELYPARCARLGDSTEEIWFRAGQNAVVEYLQKLLEQQERS